MLLKKPFRPIKNPVRSLWVSDVTNLFSDIFEQNLKSVGSSFGFSVYEGIDSTSNRSAVKLNNLWTEFQIEHNFSAAESFMSNDNNPIYSGIVLKCLFMWNHSESLSETLF